MKIVENNKKKNCGYIIGLIVILIIGLAICVPVLLGNSKTETPKVDTNTEDVSETKTGLEDNSETEEKTEYETNTDTEPSSDIGTETDTESETDTSANTEPSETESEPDDTNTEEPGTDEPVTEEPNTEEPHVHSYTESITAATCTKDGKKTFTCSCGDVYSEVIKATGHNFGSYTYNNDATYTKDGTKTAVCANCSKKDTVAALGTKLSYTFKDLNKTMWSTDSVNVRSLPSTDGNKIGSISKDEEVKVTGQCNETKWYRIEYNGKTGYVSNKYLVESIPYETYSSKDVLGDGLDDYRVGLHKYTDDGKYQCYVLTDATFGGITYYGYFINLDDYSNEEKSETAYICESAISDSPNRISTGYGGTLYNASGQESDLPANSHFRYFYDWAPNGAKITESHALLSIKDYNLVNRMTKKMIVKIESNGEIVDAWTSRPEPISIEEACVEAGITYERYLECKKIAQSYGYE